MPEIQVMHPADSSYWNTISQYTWYNHPHVLVGWRVGHLLGVEFLVDDGAAERPKNIADTKGHRHHSNRLLLSLQETIASQQTKHSCRCQQQYHGGHHMQAWQVRTRNFSFVWPCQRQERGQVENNQRYIGYNNCWYGHTQQSCCLLSLLFKAL